MRGSTTVATTTTPLAFVLVPIATGVAFLLGGFVTTLDSPVRWSLAIAGATLVVLGVFAAYIIARANTYAQRIDELEEEASKLREANTGLRSRVVFTLRSPLSAIVGNADRMIKAPDLDLQQREGLLEEIRDNAREVDGVLADLGDVHNGDSNDPRSEGLVLLDQEVRSVISTATHGQKIEQNLEPTRAWADPALVRQILRTILAASGENGHPDLTVRTQERTDRATVTFSSSEQILPAEGLAALTGNRLISDGTNTTFAALKAANQSAVLMRGTIGYTEALGMNHVIVDFKRVASEETMVHMGSRSKTVELGPAPIPKPSFTSAADFRPERPTAAIRFG
jgi:hypothetical protein